MTTASIHGVRSFRSGLFQLKIHEASREQVGRTEKLYNCLSYVLLVVWGHGIVGFTNVSSHGVFPETMSDLRSSLADRHSTFPGPCHEGFRFHIGTLVILVLVLGVGFAALRESNDFWDSGIFTLTLGGLLISILLAVHQREANRAFWIGFTLFGWAYLALSLVPSIESRLLTRKASLTSIPSCRVVPSLSPVKHGAMSQPTLPVKHGATSKAARQIRPSQSHPGVT